MADDLLQLFQSITTSDHDELVDQFAYLLQCDPSTASFFLESSNWNVQVAVNNYLVTMEPSTLLPSSTPSNEDLDMEEDEEFDAQCLTDLTAAQNAILPPCALVNLQLTFLNTGCTTWPEDTHLVLDTEATYQGPRWIPVGAVPPNNRIEVVIPLQMPEGIGVYSGSWQLHGMRNVQGFGERVWGIFHVGEAKHDLVHTSPALSNNEEMIE